LDDNDDDDDDDNNNNNNNNNNVTEIISHKTFRYLLGEPDENHEISRISFHSPYLYQAGLV
jgi:hypothetical protein